MCTVPGADWRAYKVVIAANDLPYAQAMLRLGIALPQSGAAWHERYRAGLVPDASPYGLHALERSGIQPVFDDAAPRSTTTERALNRLTGWDWTGGRPRRTSSVDAFLAWDERHGLPLAFRVGRRLPVYSGVIWASDERLSAPARQLTASTLKRAAGVFVLSRLQVPYLIEHFDTPADRIHFVRFGIDAAFFRPEPQDSLVADETIFSAGTDRHRDFDLLIRAVERLRHRRPRLKLRIATRTVPKGPLLGGIGDCLGVIDHSTMRYELARASVVAVPTKPNIHGSGMTTVLEAMSCERPVIAMAGTGLEDYIRDGVTGTLVQGGEDESLARAIDDVLCDPPLAQRQGKQGREAVLRDFTSASLADRLGLMITATEARSSQQPPAQGSESARAWEHRRAS